MSTSSWKKWLRTTLERTSALNRPLRVAILGVGNELNGDDAAGVLAARRLNEKVTASSRKPTGEGASNTGKSGAENVLVLEGGLAPENFTGVLRRFHPDLLLLIDAVWFGSRPGAIILLDGAQATGVGASTHLQPLSNLSQFLVEEMGCEVQILGIQAQQLDFDRPLSPPVRRAIRSLVDELAAWLPAVSTLDR